MEDYFKPMYGRLAIGVILTLCICISWFLVLPYIVNTFEKNQVRRELTERIHLLSNWQERYNLLTQQNEQLIHAIEKTQSNALFSNQNHLITKKIYEAANDLMLNIKKLEPNNVIDNFNKSEQEIEISLEGDYHSIAQFIQILEKSDYNIAIKSFYLRNKNKSNRIETSLIIMVTYLLEL